MRVCGNCTFGNGTSFQNDSTSHYFPTSVTLLINVKKRRAGCPLAQVDCQSKYHGGTVSTVLHTATWSCALRHTQCLVVLCAPNDGTTHCHWLCCGQRIQLCVAAHPITVLHIVTESVVDNKTSCALRHTQRFYPI